MNISDYYKERYFGIESACPEMVSIDLLKEYLVPKVLDVGCGKGLNTKKLNEHMETYGCDIFPGVKDLGKNFFLHDMEEKPTLKKFNSIFCIHVLEHIFDYISFLRNIKDSLKENGILFLAVPNHYSLLCRVKTFIGNEKTTLGAGLSNCVENNQLEPHIRYFGKTSLTKILELNGFKVKEVFGSRNGKKHFLGPFVGQLNFVCEVK